MKRGYFTNIIVPIPEGAHICGDQRVYLDRTKKYYPELRYNMNDRLWLGKAISETEMHPNETYRENYPEIFASLPHLNLPIYVKRVGMYAAVLKIGEECGVYTDLIKYLGPRSANLIMDYAVYSICTRSNTTKNFEAEMQDNVLFLGRTYSDSWIGVQFNEEITEDQIQAFKWAWLTRFNEETLKGVWICVDGTNDDCDTDIEEAEKGKAKSHTSSDIVSFLWAVTENGVPLFSMVYRGSRVDCKAIKEMITLVTAHHIHPKGVILDRGFCDYECITMLQENHLHFVVMMKEKTNGFQELLGMFRDKVKFSWTYALGNGLYGAAGDIKVFSSHELKLHAALIWDAKNGVERTDYLIDGIMEAVNQCHQAISEGRKPVIPQKYQGYISLNETETDVVVDEKKLQPELLEKGFYGLICSMTGLTAKEINKVYDLRDCSEKQYAILKTQLGFDVMRAHSMHGIQVRELVAFVSSIIRNKLQKTMANLSPRIDTNTAIKELRLVTFNLIPGNQYVLVCNQSERQKKILNALKISIANLNYIADIEGKRLRGEMVHPVQSLILSDEAANIETVTRKINGIPEGSRARGKGKRAASKMTAETVAVIAENKSSTIKSESSMEVVTKRGPGRPKGSKNKLKNTLESETVKRRPGRPKGSKNKPKSIM